MKTLLTDFENFKQTEALATFEDINIKLKVSIQYVEIDNQILIIGGNFKEPEFIKQELDKEELIKLYKKQIQEIVSDPDATSEDYMLCADLTQKIYDLSNS